nr:hypothetical protein [Deinococcus sp.]
MGQDEDAQPLVRRANFCRAEQARRRRVTHVPKFSQHGFKAEGDVTGDVFEEHPFGGFILGLLLVSLRSWVRTLRVAAPLACAVMCVTAALLLQGTQLTILHLVGLLLVVAVGSNYALFFDRGAQTGSVSYRQQTQVSLVVANLTSVGSFGLLGLSKVPVLAAIGSTVAPGAFLALVFAAILTRERGDAHTH